MKLPKFPKNWREQPHLLPIVEVTWRDATHFPGWHKWSTVPELGVQTCYTVGYLLPHTTDELLHLAKSVSVDDAGVPNIIPRDWITRVRVLS